MMRKLVLSGFFFACASVALIVPVSAQMTEMNVGVLDRARPEYDPKGLPFPPFRLFPTADVSGNYDSNIYRSPAAIQHDYIVNVVAALRLRSDWSRHFLELYTGLNHNEYMRFTDEGTTDWNVGTGGRIDITRAAQLRLDGSYNVLHEPRSSSNSAATDARPTIYNVSTAKGVFTFKPNRFGVDAGAQFDRYNFTTTPTILGGVTNNDDRDLSEIQTYLKASYDFSPGYSFFVRGSYDYRSYDQYFDRGGVHRSNEGWRYNAGLDLQLSHLLAGEVYIGYLNQRYAAPLSNVSGLDFGAKLDWYVSPLFTAHLNAGRNVSATTFLGASASTDTYVRANAEYEVLYNVLILGRASYVQSEFEGTIRTDDVYGFGLTGRYLLNRYVSADINYDYSQRSSSVGGADYTDHIVGIGLSLHL